VCVASVLVWGTTSLHGYATGGQMRLRDFYCRDFCYLLVTHLFG